MDQYSIVERVRNFLMAENRPEALALLEKMLQRAEELPEYKVLLEDAIHHGSTLQWREVASCFGDYANDEYRGMPLPYPFRHAVNGLDDAIYAVRIGQDGDASTVAIEDDREGVKI